MPTLIGHNKSMSYDELLTTANMTSLYCRRLHQALILLFKCLRNGPDKKDSKKGNERVGIQKKVLTFLLSVLTSDWLKQQKLTKLHKAVHIFILTLQPSSM